MKYADFAELTVDELTKRKRELKATIFEARMKNALGQLPNPMVIRFARLDVARVNTALHAKGRAAAATNKPAHAAAVTDAPKKAAAAGNAKKKPEAKPKGVAKPKKPAAKKAKA